MKRDDDAGSHGDALAHDLKMIQTVNRRQALKFFAGASLIPLLGCSGESGSGDATGGGGSGAGGSGGETSTGGTSTATGGANSGTGGANMGTGGANPGSGGTNPGTGGMGAGGTTPTSCTEIPDETLGPFPADGSNGPNALASSGIVRSDIRSSFGSMSGTAAGIPLTLKLTIVDANAGCAPLAGYAVYAWHCDRDGLYSLYTIATENYLRGVQETDETGTVTFTTIFPGMYPGRWPHVHFQIFRNLADANTGVELKTSQLAFPEDACDEAYATPGYESSVTNMAQFTLAQDLVFADGVSEQLATVTGNATDGFVATLTVAVAV